MKQESYDFSHESIQEVQKQIYFEFNSNNLYIDSNLLNDYYNGNYDKNELNKQLMNSLLELFDQNEAVIRTYNGFNRTYNLKNYILENNIPISFEVLKIINA